MDTMNFNKLILPFQYLLLAIVLVSQYVDSCLTDNLYSSNGIYQKHKLRKMFVQSVENSKMWRISHIEKCKFSLCNEE